MQALFLETEGNWLTSCKYQNSKTLTHDATYAAAGTSIAKTYGGPMGYGRSLDSRFISTRARLVTARLSPIQPTLIASDG